MESQLLLFRKALEKQNPTKKILIYGAYGYTGELIVGLLAKQPSFLKYFVFGGRSTEKLQQLLSKFKEVSSVETRSFSFSADSDAKSINPHLKDISVVLNCAGPFIETYKPMISACVENNVSYLDITGEYTVFEYVHNGKALNAEQLKQKKVVICPGVGFDVVPSDCLIAKVTEKYTEKYSQKPNRVEVVIDFGKGGASRGTIKSALSSLGSPNKTRKNGKLVNTSMIHDFKRVDLDGKKTTVSSVAWGDISTGYYTSGVPNISIYFPNPAPKIMAFFLSFYVVSLFIAFIMRLPLVIPLLKIAVDKLLPRGPDDNMLANDSTALYGYAFSDDKMKIVRAKLLTGKNGYTLTAETALISALKVFAGQVGQYGPVTPSQLFGSDFITTFDKCEFTLYP